MVEEKEKGMYKEKYSLHIPCTYRTNSLPIFRKI